MDSVIINTLNFKMQKCFIVFISGVPGVGKTTISYELLKMFDEFRIVEETDLIREVLRGYNEYIKDVFRDKANFLFDEIEIAHNSKFLRYDEACKPPAKHRNKFAGKEDISRQTTDNILTGQIDTLREVSRESNDAAANIRESVGILYEKRIPVDTKEFDHLSRHFIHEMELKLRKVKRPSKGLVWYIVMWAVTLLSAFLAGYHIQETRKWKESSSYWYRLYEDTKVK